MSIPKFTVATDNFDKTEEAKLLAYFRDTLGQDTESLLIVFRFSADASQKVTALSTEAAEKGFVLVLSKRDGYRYVSRWYVSLQKQVTLKGHHLLEVVTYLKELAQRYDVDFYALEPQEG